jgi:hypothetical protein
LSFKVKKASLVAMTLEEELVNECQKLGFEDLLIKDESGSWAVKSRQPLALERPLVLDLKSDFERLKSSLHSLRQQPLYRALDLSKNRGLEVWDVTLGTAQDTLLMLALGTKVISTERHPLVELLLLKSFQDAQLEGWNHWFKWRELTFEKRFEDVFAVYFDPMYEDHPQKRLSQKSMRIFRELIGKDEDAVQVAVSLSQWAKKLKKRLVIKRSLKSSFLIEKPTHSILGKTVRFDVYL